MEVVIETTNANGQYNSDADNQTPAHATEEPNTDNSVETAPTPVHNNIPPNLILQPDPEAVATMMAELSDARNTIDRQNGELTKLSLRCLQAENEAASGMSPFVIIVLFNHFIIDRGQLTSEIGEIVGARVNSGFQNLELGFAQNVSTEMRTEISR